VLAWQKSHEVAKRVIAVASKLRSGDAADVLRRQIIRAATSVPANIAEGYGGASGKGYRRYLMIARGSATELDYWLLLAEEVRLGDWGLCADLRALNAEVIAMLTTAIRSIGSAEDSA